MLRLICLAVSTSPTPLTLTLDLSSGVYQPYTAYAYAVHVSSELVIGSIFRRFGFTTLRYVFFYLYPI